MTTTPLPPMARSSVMAWKIWLRGTMMLTAYQLGSSLAHDHP